MRAAAQAGHLPVMFTQVMEGLQVQANGSYLDGTFGRGGHARGVLQRLGPGGRLLLMDKDPDAIAHAEQAFAGDARVAIRRGSFATMAQWDATSPGLDGILLDLGVSSPQLDVAERGFSFGKDGPLDMRMDPDQPTTAATLVNELDESELAGLLRRYADERFAGRIARAIVAARPLHSTVALAAVVRDAIPHAARRTGGHPATRTFQALRIAVNGELDALEAVLPDVITRLAPHGVCAALSYHSLEDRIVKRAFAEAMRGCVCPPDLPVCACGRQPLATAAVRRSVTPDDAEVAANPRASAARLRAIRRTDTPAPPHQHTTASPSRRESTPPARDPRSAPGPDRSTTR